MSTKKTISKFSQELVNTFSTIVRLSGKILGKDSDALTKGNITMPQFIALDILQSKGPLKMKDIASELHTSLPAVTGIINRLVNLKLVKRSYDTHDRRIIYINITPKGKSTVSAIRATRKKIIENVFSGLSGKEREAYLNILRKVRKNLEERIEKT
ncbi:MAG: MarR family transcriptional regulator [Candidatus Omnitrophica bacterium]|nr:MarR family transcriptional regulator [Candidatus Omnitrophota bacterium]MBD3269000.1 MarR family transcriptional regulator [Candidatus Omnitrophota bacterium]